ncbi:hypothetical protein Micbo1qcDRAFT_207158 [Microdochium bolleyi]|uniref:Uncharacterized protein n=1 Tax=Microdochium bolleyi TaxID=196109 RepID=A0A136IUB3_9PEZI|nr:hypothetical protein Micbo1qcDRAFT_207158 [Microdochium bolleyi]
MVNSPKCTNSATEWATIILTMLATNASWWLFELPLLFTHGFKTFCKSVAWQCLRNHTCGLAHLYAMRRGANAQEWAYIYYMGPFWHKTKPPPPSENSNSPTATGPATEVVWKLTRFQIALHLAADTVSLVAAGLSVREAVNIPATFWSASTEQYSGVYNVFVWIYPTVPVALTGLYMLFCSFVLSTPGSKSARNSDSWTSDTATRRATWFGLYALLAIGAVAILVPTQFLSAAGQKSFLPLTIIAYILMASPLAATSCGCGGAVSTLFCVLVALSVRMLGVVAGALVDEFYFPFCQLKSVGFAAAYGSVGVLGAGFAVWGRFYFFGSGSVGGRRGGGGAVEPAPVYLGVHPTVPGGGGGRVGQPQYYEQPQPQAHYYDGRRISAQHVPAQQTYHYPQQQQQHGYHIPQYQHAPHAQPQQQGYGWNVPSPQQWSTPANGERGWGK